ncbi:MAG: patatin-like phospholipase family protein, partial [Candidatus Omnitrophota bacterium]
MFDFLRKKKKVALALGGGSARGIAHIGVLKVLEKERIPIDAIVGTSMGAMIGAAYSVGVSVAQMEEHAYKFTTKKILDPTMPSMGLLAGKKLENTIRELIDGKGFEDCRIPLAVVAND